MTELLLGCGHSREKRLSNSDKGWHELVTVDRFPECKPDILHDLEFKPWPLASGSFDEVHAYDVLEHLGRQGDYKSFFDDFSEIYRLLKPDGLLFGITPAIASAWVWGDPSHTRLISQESLTFLDQTAYEEQVANGMSDFRWYWKGNFKLLAARSEKDRFAFIMMAIK